MNADELRERYGEEYPEAVDMFGIRMPLASESRFARHYQSAEKNLGTVVSRFEDGSASVTAAEVARDWHAWSHTDRIDFCQACCWLTKQTDLPEILRHILEHGEPGDWTGIALTVADVLPREEAFDALARALSRTHPGRCANLTQGIALTNHPGAESLLRKHLDELWDHPALWDDDEFINWIAFDATSCICHLIEIGTPAETFTEGVRRLSEHACEGNRRSVSSFLSKHYPWLPAPRRAGPW